MILHIITNDNFNFNILNEIINMIYKFLKSFEDMISIQIFEFFIKSIINSNISFSFQNAENSFTISNNNQIIDLSFNLSTLNLIILY
jgi:hypothetical protein